MKHIRNWKHYSGGWNIANALDILRTQKELSDSVGPFAIRICGGNKIIDKYYEDLSFTPEEIFSDWEVLVPDNEMESKCETIRRLVKYSNCSGLTYDKIDNMTVDEIWNHIINRLDTTQKYHLLKLYYEHNVFKKK